MTRAARATVALGAFACACLCACASAAKPDNASAMRDIQSGLSGDEVVVEGIVTHVGRSSRGDVGVHEHFDIRISSGAAEQDLLVADNITVGVAAPVRRGDDVIVRGVLEIDPSGPVIHWTHHDPAMRHPGGFVIDGGRMYE